MTINEQFAKADAAHNDYVLDHWRDWLRYLYAHRTLIHVREADRNPTARFERSAHEELAEKAHHDLAELSRQRLIRFDAEREAERQQVAVAVEAEHRALGHMHPVDADTVELQAVEQLIGRAEGRTTPTPGMGTVPVDGTWYQVNAEALLAEPTDAHYALRRVEEATKRRHNLIALAIVGGLAVFLVLYFTWPTATAAVPVLAPTINGVTHLDWFWSLHTLTLSGPNVDPLTIVLTPTTTLDWPSSDDAAAGFWVAGRAWPTTICIASDVAVDSYTNATLVATGAAPTRRYRLGMPGGAAPPDLVLVPCAGGNGTVGVMQDVLSLSIAEKATPTPLTDGSVLTLTEVQVIGPGEEPTLPSDQAAVLVTVASDRPQDWTLRAPALTLVSGQTVLPVTGAALVPAGDRLRYLIPLPEQPQMAVWSVRDQDGVLRHWSVDLTPPLPRREVLRQSLRVSRATVTEQRDQVIVQFAVTNAGSQTLRLVAEDITLMSGETIIPLSLPPTMLAPLAGGETRTLTLAIPQRQVDATHPLLITIGSLRYELAAGLE